MLLVWFAPRLRRLVRACANVLTLVPLFLLNFLVMRDVSCVRHGFSISKTIIWRVMQIVVRSLPRIAHRAGRAMRDKCRMPRLELFPFRYRDPRTGRWVRARYVAERHEIAERHPEGWEIIGPAEVRNVDPNARAFSPFKAMMDAGLHATASRLRRYNRPSTWSKRSW